jgi:pentatricopeptide repeat protein
LSCSKVYCLCVITTNTLFGFSQTIICLTPIAAFKVAARPFCSESVPLCPAVDCSVKDVEKKYNRVESGADKLYNAVIDNSNPYDNMEKALEQVSLELTTELVVEVLHRLRFEEKIAFRFFTWAGHRESYDHEPQAYNDMIDMLSSTRYKVQTYNMLISMFFEMADPDGAIQAWNEIRGKQGNEIAISDV